MSDKPRHTQREGGAQQEVRLRLRLRHSPKPRPLEFELPIAPEGLCTRCERVPHLSAAWPRICEPCRYHVARRGN